MQSLWTRLCGTPRAAIKIRCGSLDAPPVGEPRMVLVQTFRVAKHCSGIDRHNHDKVVIEEFTLHQWKPFLIDDRPARPSLHGRTYEWPFEFLVPGNQKESFRGCRRCRLAYRIEASTADGASINTRSYVPIRITRCPPISSYELMDPLTTSGKWAGSINFSASILHKAIPLGGLIPVEAHINNLDPGTLIMKARFYLLETHVAHTNSSETNPEYLQRIVIEWSLDTCGDFKQSYAWQQCLDLPRVVGQCSPDFSVYGVSMSHTLHFAATIVKDGVELEVGKSADYGETSGLTRSSDAHDKLMYITEIRYQSI
ncbi:hypothetical protein S40285_08110, partial [Stachybotrys chlorohalonatus IBT 40285]